MNILVTGVGAIIGQGILKSLRLYPELKLFGIDIYPHARGQELCDYFQRGVLAKSELYPDFIKRIVVDNNIDLIIPGIEQDLYRLHEIQNYIPCRIVMNTDLLIELSKDKWETYRYLSSNTDIDLIETLENGTFEELSQKLGLPFLLKPKSSYASKGLKIISNESEFQCFHRSGKDIFQRIVGTMENEFTVEIFGDGEGGIIDSIALKRTLAQDGSTAMASLYSDDELMNYCEKIVKATKPLGPTNIQLRFEDGKYFLLEINPRISSSCSIRTLMGHNTPKMCIDFYLRNAEIKPSAKKALTVVRYIEDWVYEDRE